MTSVNQKRPEQFTQAQVRSNPDRLISIDPATLKAWLDQGTVTLVDVREPAEYAGEHIPGAISVPLSQFDPSRIPNQIPNYAGWSVVLYCRSSQRSAQAARKWLAAGAETVTHLAGGLQNWTAQGYPTQINKKAPISLQRQVQITTGSLILTGTLLGIFVSSGFLLLSALVGTGLLFSGLTDSCALGMLLAKMPWNRSV